MSGRARQGPGRQHLRRQRRPRRHRGVADRPDRTVLVRHALPFEMGADRRRRAAERSLGRRPPVLRDPLLPRAGNGHRLHRREAVGDTAAGRRERIPRGADDPQPRREAGSAARADRSRQRLRRPVRGQGRAEEKREVHEPRRARRAAARLRTPDLRPLDPDLEQPAGQGRRERADLRPEDPGAREVEDRARRGRADARLRRAGDTAEGRTPPDDGGEPRPLGRVGSADRVRLGAAQAHVQAQPRRPGRAAVRAAGHRRAQPAGGRPALVHDHVRPRQHLHEPAGAAVHAGARGDDADGARRVAGNEARRLPRRGSGPDPARAALRRADRVRGAAALAVLRLRRRDAALRRAARRVRALDRRPQARARARVRGAGGARVDRRVRGPPGQRLRLVPAPQREDGPREPVLEGLVGLDLVPRRAAPRLPAGDLRAPGLRVRREDARRPARAQRLEGPGLR